MAMAFFKDPIFGYSGTGPEDTIGAMMMEHVVFFMVEVEKRVAPSASRLTVSR